MTGWGSRGGGAHRRNRRVDLSRSSDRAAVVAIVIAALLALLIWSPNVGGREPGDPRAVAGDARLARCGGTLADVEYAFTIPSARDYLRYLPALGRASELQLDPPALVVIYRGEFPTAASSAASSAAPSASGTIRNVCIYVGKAGEGELNYFSDVSIAGLRATPNGPVLVPPAQT
jgi:hypothetical protein